MKKILLALAVFLLVSFQATASIAPPEKLTNPNPDPQTEAPEPQVQGEDDQQVPDDGIEDLVVIWAEKLEDLKDMVHEFFDKGYVAIDTIKEAMMAERDENGNMTGNVLYVYIQKMVKFKTPPQTPPEVD